MNYQFEIIRKTRVNVLKMIEGFSINELNKIPEGFNNNLIWNVGHLVAVQQNLCYKQAGLPIIVDETYFDTYKSDTKPDGLANEADFEQIKHFLVSTIDQLEVDYHHNLFVNYVTRPTRYNVDINDIDEAITFLLFHEGLHTGYIQALKRALNR